MIEKSWAGEPDIKNLAPTICELEIYKPDYIIALGGGSVIDGAKLAWMFYEHPQLIKMTSINLFRYLLWGANLNLLLFQLQLVRVQRSLQQLL